MRQTMMRLSLVTVLLALAGCGNKGPLVRQGTPAQAPARAASTHAPATASTARGVPSAAAMPADGTP